MAMMLICGSNAFVAHVGDSRVYLVRKNKVHQLTEDHSMVNDMLKQGLITKEQAANHPRKNVITRALGIQEAVQVDILHVEFLPSDRYLICSDGLTHYAGKKCIWETFHKYKGENAPKAFIQIARKGGGHDNITAITVEIAGASSNQTATLNNSALVEKKIDTLKKIPLYSGLRFKQLMNIIEMVQVKVVDPGELVIKEGDKGEEMYVLLQGEVDVYKGTHHINRLKSGDYFGEMSLIDNVPRSATVKAHTKIKILTLSRRDLFTKLKQDSEMASKIFWFFLITLNKRMRLKEEELIKIKENKAS